MLEIVSCPKCQGRMRVPDTLLGTMVKCPHCGDAITAAISAPSPGREEEGTRGRSDGITSRKDVRRRDDDEFDNRDSDRPRSRRRDEDEYGRPRRPRSRRRKRSRIFSGLPRFNELDTPLKVVVIALAISIVTSLASVILPVLFVVPLCIAAGMILAGGLWFLLIAFNESFGDGIFCIFVPFYSLYFLISHWGETCKPFYLQVTGLILGMMAQCCAGIGLSLWHTVTPQAGPRGKQVPAQVQPAEKQPEEQFEPTPAEELRAPDDDAESTRIYLSDLEEFDVKAGAWPLGKNGHAGDPSKRQFTAHGHKFTKALWTHPPINNYIGVKYNIEPAETFQSFVGIDDQSGGAWSDVTFEVWGDGKQLWKSKVVKKPKAFQTCRVSVRDVKVLELRAYASGNNHHCHAVWIDPYIIRPKK